MNKRGYTLIEIIMAVTILALIVVPVSTLLSQSVFSNIKSKEMTIATALAQEKIEELKALSFDQVRARHGIQMEEDLKSDDFYFDRSVQIQLKNANLIKITVKVKGDNGVVHFATYRGKY
ncbi:MAG: type II secretion system protein [Thermoanaerobacteraceae bacterium]|nr:type II secretion system protein [Thermoanaerobacteraceae bacterium]